MAMQDNTVLPGAAGAGGMNPQIQAFLNLLMGGGLSGFGAFGGQPFGGFGQFLMNNPALMRGLGLMPHGAVPGPLPSGAPIADFMTPTPGSQLGATDGATTPAAAPTTPALDPNNPLSGSGIQPSLVARAFRAAVNPTGNPAEPAPSVEGAQSPLSEAAFAKLHSDFRPPFGAPSTPPPMLRKG